MKEEVEGQHRYDEGGQRGPRPEGDRHTSPWWPARLNRTSSSRTEVTICPPPAWTRSAGVKTSAAWLIERAGFTRGYGLPGPAALSTKHTLAVTNRGSATAADVLALRARGA